MSRDVEGAMFDHLRRLAEETDVPAPEDGPRLMPFFDAEDEEHGWI